MPTVTLRIRPVHSWSASDEAPLVQVLNAIGYEPCTSADAEPIVRRFESQKSLEHNLWSESNEILERLTPTLHCLFKIELNAEDAKVTRWTQVTGKPWFDTRDERF